MCDIQKINLLLRTLKKMSIRVESSHRTEDSVKHSSLNIVNIGITESG